MEEVEDAIMHERRLELAFEGHRWFDLMHISYMDDLSILSAGVVASDRIEKRKIRRH